MVELATAYVSIVAETSKVPGAISKALGGVQGQADKAGQGMGSKLAGGIGKTLKLGALAVGTAAGATLGAAIYKGMGRLTGIENAEAKLSGLGHSATAVSNIMDSALASVKGTAFGLESAASIAASAVAAGVKPGKDLERTLKLTGDAATIAGVGIEDMGSIFNKVAASNKVQGNVIMQLNKAGIPIVQLLGKEMGKTSDEILDMSRKCTISFANFQDAMEKGLGGAALTSGATFTGALANMGAAMGRFGAELLKPAFVKGPATFGLMTEQIDRATSAIKPLAAAFSSWIDTDGIPKLKSLSVAAVDTFDKLLNSEIVVEGWGRLKGIATDLWATMKSLAPALGTISASLLAASAATGFSSWQLLLAALESIAPILNVTIVPALNLLAGVMESNQGLVTALMLGFLAFKTVPSLLARVAAPLKNIGTAAAGSLGGLRGIVTATGGIAQAGQAGIVNLGRFGSVISAVGLHRPVILRMQDAFMGAAAGADRFGRMAGTAKAATEGLATVGRKIGGGFSAISGALGGPVGIGLMVATGAIMGMSSATANAKRHAEIYASTADAVTKSQLDMGNAFAKSRGQINESVLDSATAQAESLLDMNKQLAAAKPGKIMDGFLGSAVPDLFTGDIFRDDNRTDKFWENLNNSEAAASFNANLKSMGVSSDEFGRSIAGSQDEYDRFLSLMYESGAAGAGDFIIHMNNARTEFLKLKAAGEMLTPGMVELSEATGILADKSSTAASKVTALESALVALGVIKRGPEDMLAEVGESLSELAKITSEAMDGTDGLGQKMLNLDGTLNTLGNAGARQLNTMLNEMQDNFLKTAQATGDARGAWDEMTPALEAIAAASGLPIEKLRELSGLQYEIIQPTRVLVGLEGADEATRQLGDVVTAMWALDPNEPKKIRIQALDEGARKTLEGFGFKIKEVKDQASGAMVLEVEVDSREGFGDLEQLVEQSVALGELKPVITVTLDDKPFTVGADEVENAIKVISENTSTPEADLILTKFREGKEITLKELDFLSAQTADPDAKLNMEQLRQDLLVANREILEISQREYHAKIKITGEWLGSTSLGSALQSLGVQDPARRALGGPVFGAGTATSDSIPALLSNGEHVLTAAEVDAAGGHGAIYRLREAMKSGVARFATGGAVGAALSAARSKEGNAYQWGGTGPMNFDCSGFVGFIQQIVMGLSEAAAAGKRLYTTNSLLGGSTAGLVKGYNSASPFNVGVNSEHMAATLDGHAIESGGGSTPSSSGVDGGRNNALSAQFGTQFHLPLALVDGGYEGGALDAAAPVWSEKDELELQSARIAITQAQEAAQKARNDPKKSRADIEQAELKVARAELKVSDLESKKEGGTGIQALTAPPAPPLGGVMGDDAIGLRQAEMAVTDAQLARDKAYADAASTSADKEKADLAVYSAQNRLAATQKELAESGNALAATGGVKGAAQRFASDAVGIGYDAFWDIIGFNEPRWFQMDVPTVPDKQGKSDSVSIADALRDVPASFSDEDLASQHPASNMEEWLKKQRPALHDEGGWLEPGLTLNLTKRPEPVLNPEQFSNLKRIANLDQAPETREPVSEVHHHYHLTDVKQIDHLRRQERQRQLIQRGG